MTMPLIDNTFTGSGGDTTTWDDFANWSLSALPGSGNRAKFDANTATLPTANTIRIRANAQQSLYTSYRATKTPAPSRGVSASPFEIRFCNTSKIAFNRPSR
jgi:hypothetical protein